MERVRILRHVVNTWERQVVTRVLEIRWPNREFDVSGNDIYVTTDADTELMRAFAMGAWQATQTSTTKLC